MSQKWGKGVRLLCSCQLSESQIMRIKGLHGLKMKKYEHLNTVQFYLTVKSKNQCETVIQTSYDIVKVHAGELRVETREQEGSAFIIQLPEKK